MTVFNIENGQTFEFEDFEFNCEDYEDYDEDEDDEDDNYVPYWVTNPEALLDF